METSSGLGHRGSRCRWQGTLTSRVEVLLRSFTSEESEGACLVIVHHVTSDHYRGTFHSPLCLFLFPIRLASRRAALVYLAAPPYLPSFLLRCTPVPIFKSRPLYKTFVIRQIRGQTQICTDSPSSGSPPDHTSVSAAVPETPLPSAAGVPSANGCLTRRVSTVEGERWGGERSGRPKAPLLLLLMLEGETLLWNKAVPHPLS